MSQPFLPVIIIGAPRSGTNMLRDVLTSVPGVATWPCDEINYIWRHGNVRYPSDEFTPDMAKPDVCRYIRKQFAWVKRKYKVHTVIEKTCANSLRVGFVDRVIPKAKYIFIRRDGLDAVHSAMQRWSATLDVPYLLRKTRFVPATDLPYYGYRYLLNRLYMVLSRRKRLAFWGPQLEGMDKLLAAHSLEEVCAMQWRRCVDAATEVLSKMESDRWIEVGYESFVRNPRTELTGIVDFLNIQVPDGLLASAVANVSSSSVGKGRRALGKENVLRLMPLIQDTMSRYGYSCTAEK